MPSNVILEKVGARMWIARIMITWGILSACFMFTGDLHWGAIATAFNCTDAEFTFYLLRFLLGVAEAGFFPGIILYLTYWFPGPRRTKMVALFMTAIAISNAFGSPLSGAIMQYMDGVNGWRGWQWLFLLEGVPSVLIGLLVFVWLPDGPKAAKWLTPQERDLITRRIDEERASKTELGSGHHLSDAFKDIRVWALALVYLCGVVCFYAVNFWMPTIIQELGIDKKDYLKVGLYSMIPWGVGALAMVINGAHSDRTGERRWHSGGALIVAIVGLVLLAWAGKAPVPAMIGLTLAAAGLLSWVSTFWALPTAFLTGTAAAAGIAWINSVGNLGGHFGPILIGNIRTAYNGRTDIAFYALAAVAVVGVVITLMMRQRRSVEAPAMHVART